MDQEETEPTADQDLLAQMAHEEDSDYREPKEIEEDLLLVSRRRGWEVVTPPLQDRG